MIYRKTLAGIALAVLFMACGGQPEEADETAASPLDVLPETSLFSIAVVSPAGVIESIDGYCSSVELLGENAVSGWILSALDCADMNEVDAKLGVSTHGSLVVYMESMMPQSMGAALSVSDPEVFWANIGVTPASGEPLEGYEVSTIPIDFGDLYFCHTDGLLLAAGSRAGLKGMLERMDGNIPENLPEIPDGSFYLFADVKSFGPMMATQLEAMKPQILAEMSQSSTGGFDQQLTGSLMGMYFDAIALVLTDVHSFSCVLSFGPEYIKGSSSVELVEGSTLDRYLIPTETEDMTALIPAGDVMVGRFSLNPATSEAVMNAVFNAMEVREIPQDMISFWAQSTKNSAMTMMYDSANPMHVMAVYEMPEGTSLEDVKNAYSMQFGMLQGVMEMPGLEFTGVDYADYADRQWVNLGMNMDMSAMQPDSIAGEIPFDNISWNAWLTVEEDILYLEIAHEPAMAAGLIDGTYQGATAADMPEMQNLSSSSEIAFLMNIPEYFNMIMNFSGLEVPPMETDPVWIEMEVDFFQGGIDKYFRVSGTGVMEFVGQAIQMFGALAQQQ